MLRIPLWRRYLRFFGSDVRADVEDELEFHLHAKMDELMAPGLSRQAARREAARQFGSLREFRALCEQIGKEQARKMEWTDYLDSWRQDMLLRSSDGPAQSEFCQCRGVPLIASLIPAVSSGA